jgi:hypothetical protein
MDGAPRDGGPGRRLDYAGGPVPDVQVATPAQQTIGGPVNRVIYHAREHSMVRGWAGCATVRGSVPGYFKGLWLPGPGGGPTLGAPGPLHSFPGGRDAMTDMIQNVAIFILGLAFLVHRFHFWRHWH